MPHLERVLPIERRGVDEEACGRGYALLESWLVAGTLSALAHPSGPPGDGHTLVTAVLLEYWCNQPRARSFTLVSAPRIHGPRETAARRSRCPHHRDRSGAPSDRCRIARFDRAGLLEQRAVARNDAIRALF